MRTLTRTEVAKRRGKSVATVRRLAGQVLCPARDWAGVYRFEEWEVERLRTGPGGLGRWARSKCFQQRSTSHRQASRRVVHPSDRTLERTSDVSNSDREIFV